MPKRLRKQSHEERPRWRGMRWALMVEQKGVFLQHKSRAAHQLSCLVLVSEAVSKPCSLPLLQDLPSALSDAATLGIPNDSKPCAKRCQQTMRVAGERWGGGGLAAGGEKARRSCLQLFLRLPCLIPNYCHQAVQQCPKGLFKLLSRGET